MQALAMVETQLNWSKCVDVNQLQHEEYFVILLIILIALSCHSTKLSVAVNGKLICVAIVGVNEIVFIAKCCQQVSFVFEQTLTV
jgi:hypothetical protein